MEKIKGVNLGNWLVLEKWMQPSFFQGTGEEDEVWLNRTMSVTDPEGLREKMEVHRSSYVGLEDFRLIASHGIGLVRIPVPYFIFGDCPPFLGCIEYLDKAFDWAEETGLQVLIDLHTVPDSQNAYDNGGITGVCKWCQQPEKVEFALTVLERLACRYRNRKGLYGIEVVNEPISLAVYYTSPCTGKAKDKKEAKGSSYVPMSFLKPFYKEAYERLRAILPEEKAIVFHDGFRLGSWKNFFHKEGMKNVILDTHIYIIAMENFVPIHKMWVYRCYMAIEKWRLKRAERYVPVVVGEWCICTQYAQKVCKTMMLEDEFVKEQQKRFREVAKLELDTWESSCHGWIYWNYQLERDLSETTDPAEKESWALNRCWNNGWMPE
jgi:glucan 1,3-beta-glucosidase